MMKDIGVNWALTGHSERRTKNGTTDQDVAMKREKWAKLTRLTPDNCKLLLTSYKSINGAMLLLLTSQYGQLALVKLQLLSKLKRLMPKLENGFQHMFLLMLLQPLESFMEAQSMPKTVRS